MPRGDWVGLVLIGASVLLGAGLAACASEPTGTGGGSRVSIYPNPPGPTWSGTAATVTVGDRANCVLQADGTAWCWGTTLSQGLSIDIGLRGVPQTSNAATVLDSICYANTPAGQMTGWPCNVLHPVRMSTKAFATLWEPVWDAPLCGVDAAGAAYCWSQGPQYDIQPDSITSVNHSGLVWWCGAAFCASSPQRVHDATPLRSYTGPWCAVTVAGAVLCAGDNRYNLLGNVSTNFSSDTLVPVPGAPAASAVAVAPNGSFACAVAATGKVWCWGANDYGQVGINVFGGQITTPTQVSSAQTFTAIAAGLTTACALSTAGAAYCWGDGRDGQLGWNATGWGLVPYPVVSAPGRTFTQITAGPGHFCALEVGGTVWCWGDNYYGQLGVDVVPSATCGGGLCSSVPVQVQGGHTFRQISAGIGMTCGVTTASQVYCWGWKQYGRLGPGPAMVSDNDRSTTPVLITP